MSSVFHINWCTIKLKKYKHLKHEERMFTRTLQTLRNSADFIGGFTVSGVQQEFQIFKLNKAEREHFIVVTQQSLTKKHLWEDVKVVTEVQIRFGRTRFCVDLARQYPELVDAKQDIIQNIERILEAQKSTA